MTITGSDQDRFGVGSVLVRHDVADDVYIISDGSGVLYKLAPGAPEIHANMVVNFLPDVSPHVANIVVHYLGDSGFGYAPSDFYAKLIDCFTTGDDAHQRLLGEGFPGIRAAVLIYQRVRGGTDILKQRAEQGTAMR